MESEAVGRVKTVYNVFEQLLASHFSIICEGICNLIANLALKMLDLFANLNLQVYLLVNYYIFICIFNN